jgi:hypothetical protein
MTEDHRGLLLQSDAHLKFISEFHTINSPIVTVQVTI